MKCGVLSAWAYLENLETSYGGFIGFPSGPMGSLAISS